MITQSKQYHSTAVIMIKKRNGNSSQTSRRGGEEMQRGKRVEPPFLRNDDPLQTKD